MLPVLGSPVLAGEALFEEGRHQRDVGLDGTEGGLPGGIARPNPRPRVAMVGSDDDHGARRVRREMGEESRGQGAGHEVVAHHPSRSGGARGGGCRSSGPVRLGELGRHGDGAAQGFLEFRRAHEVVGAGPASSRGAAT